MSKWKLEEWDHGIICISTGKARYDKVIVKFCSERVENKDLIMTYIDIWEKINAFALDDILKTKEATILLLFQTCSAYRDDMMFNRRIENDTTTSSSIQLIETKIASSLITKLKPTDSVTILGHGRTVCTAIDMLQHIPNCAIILAEPRGINRQQKLNLIDDCVKNIFNLHTIVIDDREMEDVELFMKMEEYKLAFTANITGDGNNNISKVIWKDGDSILDRMDWANIIYDTWNITMKTRLTNIKQSLEARYIDITKFIQDLPDFNKFENNWDDKWVRSEQYRVKKMVFPDEVAIQYRQFLEKYLYKKMEGSIYEWYDDEEWFSIVTDKMNEKILGLKEDYISSEEIDIGDTVTFHIEEGSNGDPIPKEITKKSSFQEEILLERKKQLIAGSSTDCEKTIEEIILNPDCFSNEFIIGKLLRKILILEKEKTTEYKKQDPEDKDIQTTPQQVSPQKKRTNDISIPSKGKLKFRRA